MRQIPTVSVFLLSMLLPVLLLPGCGASGVDSIDIAITTEFQEARSHFLQGRDAFDLERRDDARNSFDRAIAIDTTFALAYLYRARCAEAAADQKHDLDLAQRFAASSSEGEQMLIEMLVADLQDDQLRRTSLARRLAQRFPKSPRALYEYAFVQSENQETYKARALLESAIDMNAMFAPALRAISMSYLFGDPRNLREAERYAQRYVEYYPDVADSHILLGDVYRAARQLENARGEYTQAAIVDRDSYLAFVKRGHALTFIGLYNDARRDYARAVELAMGPTKAIAANYRTLTWIYADDLAGAIEENEAVRQTLPLLGLDERSDFQSYHNTWFNRLLMCIEARRFDAAAGALEEYAHFARAMAAEVNSANFTRITESEIALLEGRLALARGEYIAARGHADRSRDFLRPIRSARKREHTELLLGQLQLAMQQPDKALEHLNEADQDLIQVKYHKAVALDLLGRDSEAQDLFREVAHWHFSNIEYALIRGKAIARLHQDH